MNITFKEVTERTKKATLMRHFTKAYFGEVITLEEAIFGQASKFICAYDGPNELGFVRIVYYGKTEIDKKYSAIWGASDGYVRPEYRGMNVLKNLSYSCYAKIRCLYDPHKGGHIQRKSGIL
jgi:hypothetical protein